MLFIIYYPAHLSFFPIAIRLDNIIATIIHVSHRSVLTVMRTFVLYIINSRVRKFSTFISQTTIIEKKHKPTQIVETKYTVYSRNTISKCIGLNSY